MIDHHEHVCHRMQAAQSTNQAPQRGWAFSPEPETRAPKAVWIAMAWGIGLTCLFVFTPAIVRFLMGES